MNNLITKLDQLRYNLEGELFNDPLHLHIYATDASVYRMLPLAVAYPKNEEDIIQLIHFATTNNTSIVPRAAGTSLAGQCVGKGIVMDMSKHFTKIISFDPKNKTVTVQPGVIRDELNHYLKPHGLFFGPNTSTSNRCMIGGMVGNNSSGTTSIKYGVTRDKVLSLNCILSDGTKATFNTKTDVELKAILNSNTLESKIYKTIIDTLLDTKIKAEIKEQFPKPEIHRRNTGYAIDALLGMQGLGGNAPFSLAPLLCGSEGTLAITTEITLQLDELPPEYEALVVTHYTTLEDGLNDVNHLMKHELYACEMIDDTILNCTLSNKKYEPYRFFVHENPKILILNELRANSETGLNDKIQQLKATITQTGFSYATPVLLGEEIKMAMELRKAGLGLLGNMVGDAKAVACIEDTAVALPDLPDYIKEFSALMKSFNQEAVYYAHAGAGELHLRPILNLKNQEGIDYFKKITNAVATLVKKYKGSFSGEHGDGIVRSSLIPFLIGDANYAVLKTVKTTFDPNGILNPGKITDAWPMDQYLRYNPELVTIQPKTVLNFQDSQGILRLAEKCNGSGDCRKTEHNEGTMCPSYQATKNEKDTTRARANALREVLTQSEKANKFDSPLLKEVFDLCLSCKACATECPSNVDIATAKAEFLYQYQKANGTSLSTKLFGKSSFYNKQAARFPRLSNSIFSFPLTASVIKKVGGIAQQRSIPKLSTERLVKPTQHHKNQLDTTIKKVYLFVDEFSNYLDKGIANDAIVLLSHLGYTIKVITHLDSARALISKGFLDQAKEQATKNVLALKNKITTQTPLVGIEPSALLGFRDEYLRMVDDVEATQEIASHSYLFEEFVAKEIESGAITASSFTTDVADLKIHCHCHQKALSNQKHTFTMLNLPLNYKATIMTTGCCGMAGSFGYEKDHYEVSMQIGELSLFPKVRKASLKTIIAANGTSCREQIKDGTQRIAKHPITILREALVPSIEH